MNHSAETLASPRARSAAKRLEVSTPETKRAEESTYEAASSGNGISALGLGNC